MKVWITKYALTVGIACEPAEERDGTYVVVRTDRSKGWGADQLFHGEGREWHRTEAGAVARAEEMRVAKIASLRKQIDKLEKLKFGVSEPAEATHDH